MQKRIKSLDIAKGLGIIAIVWGHAYGLFSRQFIILAVPLFFIISGYLHNSQDSYKTFFKKKFFRLYLPFICCNLFLPIIVLIKRFSLGLDIKNNLIYIFQIIMTLNKDGFLFGATWFLGNLFLISVLTKFLETRLKTKWRYIIICLLSAVSILIFNIHTNIQMDIKRMFVGSLFYIIGILIAKNADKLKTMKTIPITILSFIVLFFSWNQIAQYEYTSQSVKLLVFIVLNSLCFTFLCIKLSNCIEKNTKFTHKIFEYIGKHSFHILIWHFVFFEILSAIILKINNIPISNIEMFPHVVCTSVFCKILYFLFGIFGPLLLSFVWSFIKNKLKYNY